MAWNFPISPVILKYTRGTVQKPTSEVPQKVKYRVAIWLRNSSSRYMPKITENR